ncbi:MAG: histone deacetylase family protein [Syntrophobacterales bacterium]|jgi:acetoin utilization deacetylase AcuC-like enzyme
MMPPLLLVYHEQFLTSYYTSTVECPARVKVIHSKLREHFPVVEPEPAERRDILRVHAPAMVNRVENEGRDTYQTALLAVGGAIRASNEAMQGVPAFALVRPPGHHAGPDHYWGFCFFNNISVAITRLLESGTITSVLVLDLDLHHGDGTEKIFMDNIAVRVLNVRSKTRTAYIDSLQQVLEESANVDLLAVSAGFDTYIRDWGGVLHTEDYRAIGAIIREGARHLSRGRFFAVLEGGYYLPDLGANALAFSEGLAGL